MVGVGYECMAGSAFAEEKLNHNAFFSCMGGYGFSGGRAWCGDFLGSKMRDGGERVDFADRGSGVVDVEVSERGVACTTIKPSTWEG